MRKAILALAATTTAVLGALAPVQANAATGWNDGSHDEDTIIDCITQSPSTGLSANVSWSSPSGQVPRIGEKFYLRGFAGLVGLPCSGKVAVMPEIMVPQGVTFVDEDVRWDLTRAGEQQQLGTDPLGYFQGLNGGVTIGNPDDSPFVLRQGDVLEFQFPVMATRELKGPATQQPTCQRRLDGVAPCPISQSGDHFQVAFTVAGHGGDKSYVTPFVGLFASNGSTPPPPAPAPSPVPGPAPAPAPAPAPGPGQDPAPGAAKAASSTSAAWRLANPRRGRVVVNVRSSAVPTGTVVIRDKGRRIARAVLTASDKGRITVTLPRLRKGKHQLVAQYLGSDTTRPSASSRRTVQLR